MLDWLKAAWYRLLDSQRVHCRTCKAYWRSLMNKIVEWIHRGEDLVLGSPRELTVALAPIEIKALLEDRQKGKSENPEGFLEYFQDKYWPE